MSDVSFFAETMNGDDCASVGDRNTSSSFNTSTIYCYLPYIYPYPYTHESTKE